MLNRICFTGKQYLKQNVQMCPCHNIGFNFLLDWWPWAKVKDESIFLLLSYQWDGMIYRSDNEKRNLLSEGCVCENYIVSCMYIPGTQPHKWMVLTWNMSLECGVSEEKARKGLWNEQKNSPIFRIPTLEAHYLIIGWEHETNEHSVNRTWT